jgi:hypothetical protein
MDQVPKAPEWKMQDVALKGFETAKPVILFYRDPLECIQVLLRNPAFEGRWDFIPRRIYDDPDRQNRLYSEWMTSDGAWAAQVRIHPRCSLHRHPPHPH